MTVDPLVIFLVNLKKDNQDIYHASYGVVVNSFFL